MRNWIVEFDFFTSDRAGAVKTGFKSYEEAIEWVEENQIEDASILWEEEVIK